MILVRVSSPLAVIDGWVRLMFAAHPWSPRVGSSRALGAQVTLPSAFLWCLTMVSAW